MLLFALVFFIAAGLCIYAVVRYLRHDRRPVILVFAVYMTAIGSWELLNFLIDAVTAEQLKLLGKNIVNAVSVPVTIYAIISFTFIYTDHKRWIRWVVLACAVHITCLSVALFVAPELLYESNGLVTQGPFAVAGFVFERFVVLDRTLKPAFLIYWLYTVLLESTAIALLVRYTLQNRQDVVRGQMSAVLVGISAPLFASALLFAGVVPPAWNPTDLSYIVTAVAFTLAVFRYRLFRLIPVGRQQLVRIMGDPVILIDDANRVVDSNPTARDLFGVGPNWQGIAASDFFTPLLDDVNRILDITAADTEISIAIGDTIHHFSLNISPIQNGGSVETGQLIVMRNITEQKDRQQKLEETTQELELSNEKLSRFAGMVSHDLRNPLNVISGRAELLRGEAPTEHVEPIVRSTERMDAMIEELLTLSKAGKSVEKSESIPLAGVAADSWGAVEDDTVSLELDIPEDVEVRADANRLQHIFENFFRNAGEHNDSPVTIRVGTLQGGEESISGFFVEDDGIGIPESDSTDIFEQGYTTHTDGTGFGLSIVEEIVTAHGWTVTVAESDMGGVRFNIDMTDPV